MNKVRMEGPGTAASAMPLPRCNSASAAWLQARYAARIRRYRRATCHSMVTRGLGKHASVPWESPIVRIVFVLLLCWLAGCEDEKRLVCGSVIDCPGDRACTAVSCDGHICTYKPLAEGEPATTQTSGDCKLASCDGAGGTVEMADDTDLPTAMGECATAR